MAKDTKDTKVTVKVDGAETAVKDVTKLADAVQTLKIKTTDAADAMKLYKSILTDTKKVSDNQIKDLGRLVPQLKEVDKITNSMLKMAQQTATMQLANLNSEMEGLKKTTVEVKQLEAAYKAKADLLNQQAEIAKKLAEQEIEAEKNKGMKAVDLAKLLADRELAIDTKLKEDLKANDADYRKSLEEGLTSLMETVKHKGGFWKGIVDVDATKKNNEALMASIAEEKKTVADGREAIKKEYEEKTKDLDKNSEEYKALMAKRDAELKEYDSKYASYLAKLAELEKKNQNLRLGQWGEYSKKFSENMQKINEKVGVLADAASAFFKQQAANTEDEIQSYKDKVKEQEAVENESKYRVIELDRELNDRSKILSLQRIQEIDNAKKEEAKIQKVAGEEKTKFEAEQKRKELEKRKQEKNAQRAELVKNIGVSIANIAQGVTKALAMGPIIGPVMAAMVSAMGAVQIATMTKQLAKLEDGGLLDGKRHSEGGMRIEGTNIEVEGGEYVVNRRSTRQNLGLIRYINSQERALGEEDVISYFSAGQRAYDPPFRRAMEDGGQVPVINNSVSVVNDHLVDAIRNIRFEPRVAVTDIIRAQDQVASVDSWTGM